MEEEDLTGASVAQLVGGRLKGHGFDSQSGYMPRLWVPSLVRVRTRSQPTEVSLSLSKKQWKKKCPQVTADEPLNLSRL